MNSIQAAGVIAYRYNNDTLEFLLVQHRHGHWEFPKGKLDAGETERQAAIRELAEEAGVTCELHDGFCQTISYTFFDRYANQQLDKQVHFFLGVIAEGQHVTISDEHSDSIWLTYEQAQKYLSHTESHGLLEKAYSFLKRRSS